MSYQKRKIEIREHEAWQKSIASNPPAPDYDEIDFLVGDAEKHLNRRSRHGKNSVLRILDELNQGRTK